MKFIAINNPKNWFANKKYRENSTDTIIRNPKLLSENHPLSNAPQIKKKRKFLCETKKGGTYPQWKIIKRSVVQGERSNRSRVGLEREVDELEFWERYL